MGLEFRISSPLLVATGACLNLAWNFLGLSSELAWTWLGTAWSLPGNLPGNLLATRLGTRWERPGNLLGTRLGTFLEPFRVLKDCPECLECT